MPFLCGDNCFVPGVPKSSYLTVTDTQYFYLQQWARGRFTVGAVEPDPPGLALDRAAIENCVGGAFSPGIEMTWISRNPQLYSEPFRIKHRPDVTPPLSLGNDFARGMEPGDVRKYLACPWQADFNECSQEQVGERYAARGRDDLAAITLFSDDDLVRQHALARPDAWCRLLHQTWIGGGVRPDRLGIASAATHCLRRVHGEGWLATGGAATAWDPLAAAGVMHALRTGIAACSALARHLDGDPWALPAYARGIVLALRHYLPGWLAQYATELRWSASPFWSRRRLGLRALLNGSDGAPAV